MQLSTLVHAYSCSALCSAMCGAVLVTMQLKSRHVVHALLCSAWALVDH